MNVAVQHSSSSRLPPVLAVGGRFGKYYPEPERDIRKPDVVADQTLAALLKALRTFLHEEGSPYAAPTYKRAVSLAKKLRYSSTDVEKLSLAMAELQDEKGFEVMAGFFLSALINKGPDGCYVLHVNHLKVPLGNLCVNNVKDVTIEGDVGFGLGCEMKKGVIRVEGNADSLTGDGMRGGEIHVDGTVRNLGQDLRGGKIYQAGVLIYG